MRVLLSVLMVLAVLVPTRSHGQTETVVDVLLTELQRTLVRVRDASNEEDLPPLTKATLNLKSVLNEEAGGEVSLFVIQLGSKVEKAAVQEIRLELGPPHDSDRSPASSASDLLADAIIQSTKAVKRARDGTPPLHLHKLTAAVRFVLSSDTGANAGFNILPVTVQLGGKVETQAVQELIVEFEH